MPLNSSLKYWLSAETSRGRCTYIYIFANPSKRLDVEVRRMRETAVSACKSNGFAEILFE